MKKQRTGYVLLDEGQTVETLSPNTRVRWLPAVLKKIGFASSTSQGRRLIQQGAVRVYDEGARDVEEGIPVERVDSYLQTGRVYVLKVGRKWAKVHLEESDA
jgi:tyrosyl-tRNA synthetase